MIGTFATGLCVFVAFIVICMLIIRVGSHEEEPLVVEHIAFGAGAAALLYAVFFAEPSVLLHLLIIAGSFALWMMSHRVLVVGPCPDHVDMTDKTVIVTGANAGIGFEIAKLLADMGAHVILACRSLERGEAAASRIRSSIALTGRKAHLECLPLDLCSNASIRRFVADIKKRKNMKLFALINNAGGMFHKRSETEDGLETTMACNYFGPFLLTNLLVEVLEKTEGSRIVNVSSSTHKICKSLPLQDLNVTENYSLFGAYSASKLALVIFTKELSRRLEGKGVTAVSCHPGNPITDITRNFPVFLRILYKVFQPLFHFIQKKPMHGAYTPVFLATTADVERFAGEYIIHCAPAKANSLVRDQNLARQLWTKTASLVQL